MAEKKFQDYTDLGVAPEAGDFLLVRDVSDTTDSPDGTLKEATVTLLRAAIVPVTLAEVSDAGALAAEDTVGTALVDNDAITYAKIQNVSAASRLLGRGDSGAGDPQEITLGSGLSMSGNELSASGSGLPADDTTALVQDPVDTTKRGRIDVGAVATATTRAIIMGDRDVDLGAGGTFAELSHVHSAADITSGLLADARVPQSAITQHQAALSIALAQITGDGALAALNTVGENQIDAGAVVEEKLANGAVTGLKIAADAVDSQHVAAGALDAEHYAADSVGADALAHTAVTPGSYTLASITVDQQGRITAASSGTGADAAGSLVASVSGALAVTTASHALHKNVLLTSDQASSVFTIAKATAAGTWFAIAVQHDTCTVVVEDGAGSINGVSGATGRLVNGGIVLLRVMSNAGAAPVIAATGNIIVAHPTLNGTKTYATDDHGKTYVLVSGAGTQTFDTAVAAMFNGYETLIKNRSGGNITIDGLDNDHILSDNGDVLVAVDNGKLIAIGSDGVTVLDAA